MNFKSLFVISAFWLPFVSLGENFDALRQKAAQGSAQAQYEIGTCYYSGKGVQQDYAEAVRWYRLAADQGYEKAQGRLGFCYKYGKGVSQDFLEAMKWFCLAADQGEPSAQLDLGNCYYDGQGVAQDYIKAVQWYRRAAEQKYSIGQLRLGNCYYDGKGVPQDYAEAVKWYRLAAERHTAAQRLLGDCYYHGTGVIQDYAEAAKWYRIAAENGERQACYYTGLCYYHGRGVPQDYAEAVKWYRLAAEKRYTEAQYRLGDCYYYGNGVLKDYTEAVKWFQLASQQGHAKSQCALGFCYYYGEGVSQDYSEAVKWYHLAAEQGNAEAQFRLGRSYALGRGVSQNYPEAVKWYRLASAQGDRDAQYELGFCYYVGKGVPQNYAEAVKWYRLASDQGNRGAQYELGFCYYAGTGVPQNYAEAVKLFRLAAEQGDRDAQYELGFCYYVGNGVPQNYAEAVKWYRLAAEQGNAEAQFRLGLSYALGHGVLKDYSEAVKWYSLAAAQGHTKAAEYASKEAGSRLSYAEATLAYEHGDPKSANGIICNTNVSRINFPDYLPERFESARVKALSGLKQDRGNFFNLYATYVKDVYATFQDRGGVVKSYRSKDKIGARRDNYALSLETFFNKTTTVPVSPGKGAFVKTKEGLQIEIQKIYSDDTDAVFTKDGVREKRVAVSDLSPSSEQLARAMMVDKEFGSSFEISADRVKEKTWEGPGSTSFRGATESYVYEETAFHITLENRAELPIDSLIVEYQIFFKQTVAGTLLDADDDYRFAGYSIVKEIPPNNKITITAKPPAITENKIHPFSSQSGNTEWTFFLRYPDGCNQKSQGRMRGCWVRVHRITPYGHLISEFKDGIYPEDAEWDAIEMLHNQ
jgi:TPR repeat protein